MARTRRIRIRPVGMALLADAHNDRIDSMASTLSAPAFKAAATLVTGTRPDDRNIGQYGMGFVGILVIAGIVTGPLPGEV